MCTVCGCDSAGLERSRRDFGAGHGNEHEHGHQHGHEHGHEHEHESHHTIERRRAPTPGAWRAGPEPAATSQPADTIDFGAGLAGVSVTGLSQERTIRIERDILSRNAAFAASNRHRILGAGALALNVLSSPGSGKTSILVRTITDLCDQVTVCVIEGDQQTSNDADRIRRAGAQAIQINTGKGCHLDAHMIGRALEIMPPPQGGVLLIENVGNLVCPAAFDLGEAAKIVVLSVTEGEDKPLKYPDVFAAADLMLLNKIDLLPHVEFDVEACFASALRVNPRLQILMVSARTGDGLSAFYAWIKGRLAELAALTLPSAPKSAPPSAP